MKKNKSEGFTLIELIIAIAILGILVSIAIPRFIGYRELAGKTVCETNRMSLARHYEMYFLTGEEGESNFNQFMNENFDKICPTDGIITYEDEKVRCSVHKDESESGDEEPPDGEVPWL